MEDTDMTKKEYMKPSVKVVELQQKCQILAGSIDSNGMNNSLQNEEVEEAGKITEPVIALF